MAKPPVEEQSNKLKNDKKAAYHRRLAIHVLLEQQIKVLKDRAAANLKAGEQEGIPGKKLKVTYKLAKEPPSKIAQHYAEEFELLEFQGINVTHQFNLLGGVDITAPKKGPDFYGAGLMAAMDGKDGTPPKNLKGPDQQRWMEGWNDGVAAIVYGKDYLKGLSDQAKAAANDGRPEGGGDSDGQVDLEDAVDKVKQEEEGAVISVGLSEFGPEAVLAEIELTDLGLDPADIEKARRIEVVDADGRRNVLKNTDGETGLQDPLGADQFEASEEELASQKARPSTQAAADPAGGEQ